MRNIRNSLYSKNQWPRNAVCKQRIAHLTLSRDTIKITTMRVIEIVGKKLFSLANVCVYFNTCESAETPILAILNRNFQMTIGHSIKCEFVDKTNKHVVVQLTYFYHSYKCYKCIAGMKDSPIMTNRRFIYCPIAYNEILFTSCWARYLDEKCF